MARRVAPLRPPLRAWFTAVALVAIAGCAGAGPAPAAPPPAPPSPEPVASAEPAAAPEPTAAPDAPEPEAARAGSAAAPPPAKDDSIPEVYEMSNGDCDTLAKQLGDLTRSDQRAGLSKQLTKAQRASAEKSIDDAAAQIQDRWVSMCQGSLVGKVVDPKSLKCALDAKTVKAFDVCLNGGAATSTSK